MDDQLIEEFTAGVYAYQGGDLPDGWDDAKRRAESPYLTGWWLASLMEVDFDSIYDRDGECMNPDGEGY